jgi:hypothetical protein
MNSRCILIEEDTMSCLAVSYHVTNTALVPPRQIFESAHFQNRSPQTTPATTKHLHTTTSLLQKQTNIMGSVVLPHLVTGWHVDQAIMSEDERLVIIRFGRDWDPDCMRQDEVLYRQYTLPQISCFC